MILKNCQMNPNESPFCSMNLPEEIAPPKLLNLPFFWSGPKLAQVGNPTPSFLRSLPQERVSPNLDKCRLSSPARNWTRPGVLLPQIRGHYLRRGSLLTLIPRRLSSPALTKTGLGLCKPRLLGFLVTLDSASQGYSDSW